MPSGFDKGTKQVSVGAEQVCAVNQKNKLVCWDYNSGVKNVPDSIKKSDVAEVSAGQHHNCAISKLGKLVCWPVDEN